MPAAEELVAHNRNEAEIAEFIGADRLFYQDIEDLIDAVQKGNRSIKEFDCSCFDGQYVTRTVDEAYLAKVRNIRNDSALHAEDENAPGVGMELHNNA